MKLNKKTKTLFSRSTVVMLLLTVNLSCDDGFAELNTDPTKLQDVDTHLMLPYIWAGPTSDRFTTWRTNLIITSSWVQHLSSGFAYDTYDSNNDQYTGAYMDRLMPTYMAEAIDIIEKNQGTPVAGIGLLFKVHFMLKLVDMHGMIPYSEAFRPAEILQPQYDEVEVIYATMMNEVREAITLISAGYGDSKNPGNLDPVYGGDLVKWGKFANSLLLRLGLRLSEVDPATAQQVVAEAVAGGIFESNDDEAYIYYEGGVEWTNGINGCGLGEVFFDFGVTGHLFRYSEAFVSFMMDNNDPRDTILMATYDSDENITNGTSEGQIGQAPGSAGFVESTYIYAQPNRSTMVRYESPFFLLTYAEAEFNLAEAIERGWVTNSGTAAEAYNRGVRGAIKMLEKCPNTWAMPEQAINDYLAQPQIAYQSGEEGIRLINTQKWVALLFDGYEAFANYRRIGYPELTPVDEEYRNPMSDGTMPKRVIYPISEVTTNTENYNRALEIQGADDINTRLWWDVD